MLCYVMLCYVMLCYVMLCYVMLCYVTLSILSMRLVPCIKIEFIEIKTLCKTSSLGSVHKLCSILGHLSRIALLNKIV